MRSESEIDELLDRYAAAEADLVSRRAELRRLRDAYAVVDASKFARFRSVAALARDAAGLGGAGRNLAVVERGLLASPIDAVPNVEQRREPSDYERWLQQHAPREDDVLVQRRMQAYFPYRPTVSIVVPTYETAEEHLVTMLESVLAQSYPLWQLCVADDRSPSPHVRETLEAFASRDPRIVVTYREENGHISAASNSALALATGEFVGLLDHDDVLSPDALFHVVALLNERPDLDYIYSDEDKLAEDGTRYEAFFKPDWSPDAFLSRMYTCHFSVFRRSLLEEIGGFRLGYEGSQDYDLVLRFTERTDRVAHVPRVLYSWRVHPLSAASSTEAKPYAYVAAQKALAESMARRGEPGRVEHVVGCSGLYVPRFDLRNPGRVSIVIPTRDRAVDLERCLSSVFTSSWSEFDVVLVDNGTRDEDALAVIARWRRWAPERVKVVERDEPFNFSRLINVGAGASDAPYLVLLNNDTEVVTRDWLERMMEWAQRPAIGAVGCKLLFPDARVQHAGIVLGLGGAAGHGHYRFHDFDNGYFGALKTVNNYSAVTAACMMVRRDAFERVAGFDEEFSIAYNDVDFCLRLREQGLRNVYLPHVELKHYESVSRGSDLDPVREQRNLVEQELLIERWHIRGRPDPYYNPNLALTDPDYRIAIHPAQRLVFRDQRLLDQRRHQLADATVGA